ncbi:MAG: hypothetical protein ACRERD_05090 [Candidatus Binatia bacterium]
MPRDILGRIPHAVYLGLERPADLNRLRDPEAFFALDELPLFFCSYSSTA